MKPVSLHFKTKNKQMTYPVCVCVCIIFLKLGVTDMPQNAILPSHSLVPYNHQYKHSNREKFWSRNDKSTVKYKRQLYSVTGL